MPIPRQTVAPPRSLQRDRVYDTLRTAIVDGTLEPGERLLENELVGWLNCSRTPIREALTHLEKAGLVEIRPGRSTTVAPLERGPVADAQAVVASMHALAARAAVPRAAVHDLDAMEEANRSFGAALLGDDVDLAIATDAAFHRVFVDLAGNRLVASILDDVTPLLRRMERVRFASLTGRESVAQHARIIELTRAGDVEGAAAEVHANWMTLTP